jgi:hypothetical protein
MFPRAARFDAKRLSDTPGPNAYDPREMLAHYKRGPLHQKDARFKSGEQQRHSNEGASTSALPAMAPSNQAPGLRNSSASTVMKEKARLSTKLASSEERICTLEKQTKSLANEKSQALAELSESLSVEPSEGRHTIANSTGSNRIVSAASRETAGTNKQVEESSSEK